MNQNFVYRSTFGVSVALVLLMTSDQPKLGSKQVDKDENHVQFSANGTRAEGRNLILAAESGEVLVESVHVLT